MSTKKLWKQLDYLIMKINHLRDLTVHSGSQLHELLYKQLKQIRAICVDHKLIALKTWNLITLGKFSEIL